MNKKRYTVNWSTIYSNNSIFINGYLAIFICTGILLLFSDQIERHIWINQFNHSLLDQFFRYLTHLGDGLVGVIIILIFLFVEYKKALQILFSFLGSALIAQFLKRLVFEDHYRPKYHIDALSIDLHLIEDLILPLKYSFPSGHATSAYAVGFSLLLISRKKNWKKILFLLSFLAAYSRVYLSFHFIEDIWMGSLIGTGSSLLSFKIVENWNNPSLQLSLRSVFRSKEKSTPHV
jgi:membrane-associated phospholipid phosphatase